MQRNLVLEMGQQSASFRVPVAAGELYYPSGAPDLSESIYDFQGNFARRCLQAGDQ